MALDSLVRLTLLTSIWLLVLSIGARASPKQALFMMRQPEEVLRSLGAMFIVVPAIAVFVAATAPIPSPIKFAIVTMSVGPVPPILPLKQTKTGGEQDYAVGLLVLAALASLVLTPLLVALAARLLGAHAAITTGQVVRPVLITIGLPLVVGFAVRATSQRAGDAVAAPAQRIGTLLLLVVFVAMVVAAGREILDLLGNGAALAIAATVALALLTGHLLGKGSNRAALALAAATRHPGVALAIGSLNYPDQQKAIMAALLLFLVITLLVTGLYVRWTRRRGAPLEANRFGQA